MDLTTKTPDSENDTPPHHTTTILPLIKPLSFSNGTIKNHHQQPLCAVVTYKECMKNHAASIGGHAVDGCGEFMPSPDATPSNPTSLKCAACGCHRNFHRRDPAADDPSTPHFPTHHFIDFRHHALPPIRRFSPSPSLSPQPLTPTAVKSENQSGRKRFRTRFTAEQKEKMHSFAEKLGWKLQKCDEGAVKEFCSEIGVEKSVLRVWMHNNKNTFGKKPDFQNSNGMSFKNINGSNNDDSTTTNCGLHLHISTNASSSSS